MFIATGADTEADRESAEDATGDPLRQGVLAEDHQLAGGTAAAAAAAGVLNTQQ